MSKTIVVVGFGPGVSRAVAEKFGMEGFSVVLVGRNEERLAGGVAALKAKGITASAVPGDAANPDSIRAAIRKARTPEGPITVIHWNAFSGSGMGDLLEVNPTALKGVFDVAVTGLLSAVQEALPDLTASGEGAVLITNGALGEFNEEMDQFANNLNSAGVALANAAKAKLAGLLAQRLKGDGVYVGEVTIAASIKGTPWDNENSIEASKVSDRFWELYEGRKTLRARAS
jgi:NAD(P)-dependent dehydrogenase (short-subunit alcohol dehydrogenase family)